MILDYIESPSQFLKLFSYLLVLSNMVFQHDSYLHLLCSFFLTYFIHFPLSFQDYFCETFIYLYLHFLVIIWVLFCFIMSTIQSYFSHIITFKYIQCIKIITTFEVFILFILCLFQCLFLCLRQIISRIIFSLCQPPHLLILFYFFLPFQVFPSVMIKFHAHTTVNMEVFIYFFFLISPSILFIDENYISQVFAYVDVYTKVIFSNPTSCFDFLLY